MSNPASAELIDTVRYPITSLETPEGERLIDECRRQLASLGACELPGFLNRGAATRLATEAEALAPLAYRSRVEGTCYLDLPDESYPEDHPKRVLGPNALGAVAYDLFPATSGVRALYECPALHAFVAAMLDEPSVYPYADPLGALNLAVMEDGDELAWHFDQTDFVVSLALVPAVDGGSFDYVPRVRSAFDERYDDVASVLSGADARIRRLPMVAGTLLLFAGRYSLHRVTPVRGSRARLVALLAFDTKPGTTSSELLRLVRYGRAN